MKKIATYITLFIATLILVGCGGGTTPSGSTAANANALNARALTNPAPTITSFYPAWQYAGSAITIYGTNFDTNASNNAVNFSNKQQAVVASATSTSLVVIVPAGASYGTISVTTSGGKASSTNPFVVRTSGSNSPTITSLPSSGTLGSSVTIGGTNFDAVKENNLVTFNGTPALVSQAIVPTSAVMATSLVVTVPDATNGNLTVTTPNGTAISSHTFIVNPPVGTQPVIQSFSPLRGVTGTSLTISGLNFDPVAANNTVKFFNGVAATVTASSASSVTVTVPAGVANGPLTLGVAGNVAKSAAIYTNMDGVVPPVGQKGGAIQGTPSGLLGTVLTYAGGRVVTSAANGAAAARFNNPNGITTDGTSLYVADSSNRMIRRIDFVSGVATTTTIAGSGLGGAKDGSGDGATFSTPNGITSDGVNLYVADSGNNRVRKISPPAGGTLGTMTSTSATVTTLAGSGSLITADNANGLNAGIKAPYGIATDGVNLYVTDGSNRIRRINIATSAVTTLAGSGAFKSQDGTGASCADGVVPCLATVSATGVMYSTGSGKGATNPAPETVASFYRPHGIVITPDKSTLYVTDSGTNAIRKVVIATGAVSTLMGPGFNFTNTTAGSFQNPNGLAISANGLKLYVADTSKNRILQVDLALASNNVTNLAGLAGPPGSVDGVGTLATFHLPNGLVLMGADLYVTDAGNNLIRKVVVATQTVTTIAGSVVNPADMNGTGTSSEFFSPYGITSDGSNLYIADSRASQIRKIVIASGAVTTIAGSYLTNGAVDARGYAARFSFPFGVTTDGKNLYVADTGNNTIRQVVIATGDVTTLAGSGVLGSANGTGTAASFNQSLGITTDGVNVYVADTENNQIRQIVIATGVVTTLAGSGGVGATNGIGAAASFNNPAGVTTDGTSVYVADSGNNLIRQIDIATGNVTTLAGSGASWYNDVYDTVNTSWTGVQANFNNPTGITTDGTNLYVTDSNNNEVRKIVITTRVVTTLSGSGIFGKVDGTGTEASFSQPVGITTDGINLYTTDYQSNLIRKIQ
ncbi:MAG: hypothetical protein EPO42_07290 [Gallionellaceae bacterium]|nr:MAG: hypothetical protein EPO42_07290 [Gallionellaceae bacterium]